MTEPFLRLERITKSYPGVTALILLYFIAAWHIVRGMLIETSRTASIGLAVGLVVAAALVRLLSASTAILSNFGARPFLVGAAIVLGATAVATLSPLRDAARIDPAQALRSE